MVATSISPANLILDWFDLNQRSFPWRATGGEDPNSYWVWLSEIMLQQTNTTTVQPYFLDFIKRWPTVNDLASAKLDQVLHAWQGLGYYARARNLHKCAKIIVEEFNGEFPDDEKKLLSLPGIGPYTAAAISAIAFEFNATPVDGNVERVMARLNNVTKPLPMVKRELIAIAKNSTPQKRFGDYAQAVMDLGATVCVPKKPKCSICPCKSICIGFKAGNPEKLPQRSPKRALPTRYAKIYFMRNHQNQVFIRRREEKGLLGGMMELPSTEWSVQHFDNLEESFLSIGIVNWKQIPNSVKHTFTHFHLEMQVYEGVTDENTDISGIWCNLEDLDKQAFPSLMKKVLKHAMSYLKI